MPKKPIYRYTRVLHVPRGDDGNPLGSSEAKGMAWIEIPDALMPGDGIHLSFKTVTADGRILDGEVSGMKGGGFLRIDDDGRMVFDGT